MKDYSDKKKENKREKAKELLPSQQRKNNKKDRKSITEIFQQQKKLKKETRLNANIRKKSPAKIVKEKKNI